MLCTFKELQFGLIEKLHPFSSRIAAAAAGSSLSAHFLTQEIPLHENGDLVFPRGYYNATSLSHKTPESWPIKEAVLKCDNGVA